MQLADLQVPALPEYVALARLVVSSIADDRYALTDDQLDDLKWAVSEACVMAIESQNSKSDGRVVIKCEGNDNQLEVIVNGKGKSFPRDSHDSGLPQENIPELSAEIGLPLLGSLVDHVAVEDVETGNRLRMTMMCERAEEL